MKERFPHPFDDAGYDNGWTLRFERDGTEHMAVIYDANDEVLVASSYFCLPEGDDPVPDTLASVRLMAAAPSLLAALEQIFNMVTRHPLILNAHEQEWYCAARDAIHLAKTSES